MKILFVTSRYLPDLGGVEKHVYKVSKNLIINGNEITIITATERKDVNLIESKPHLKILRKIVKRKRSSTNLINYLYWIFFVVSKMSWFLVKKYGTLKSQDIIHLQDWEAFLWIAPLMPFLIKKPIFITFLGFERYPVSILFKTIRKIAEKTTRGNICVGEYIVKWYGTKTDYVNIGGTDLYDGPIKNPTIESILYFGRLAEDTNIIDFMEVMKILKDKYGINIPFHICGDGPLRSKIEEYANTHNIDVIFHGFVSDVSNYLINCKYVFSSGLIAILESMAYKRPVFSIYSNPLKKDYLYSIPNAVNILVISGSTQDLAGKFYNAFKHPELLEAQIDKAYDFAKQQSWENVANTYTKLYRDKVGNRN